tara:strand:+ start:8348 stop:9634 length:1287 start_codon:yes stop_codon:yes gene_type:complete
MTVTLKTNFARLREKTGLSREEVAARAGYNVRTIYRWEAGETRPRKPVMEMLRTLATADGATKPANTPGFRFIDLFAGIGGIRIGFDAIGGQCVFTSEWDQACRKTYQANFAGDHPIEGDITLIDEQEIPEHDVLLAGFPCQPFSIAGVSKKNALGRPHGFLDNTQGTLFFDVARILAWHRPPVFLLENVKNLLGHDRGKTFKVIRDTLTKELGYHVETRVINGKAFTPQNRERIFIAGFRQDTGFRFDDLVLPDRADWPTMKSVLHPENGSEEAEPPFTEGPKAGVNGKYTLSEKLWDYLQGYAKKHREKGNGFGFGLVGPDDVARTLSARYYKDGSEILIRQVRKRPRRMTPRECARLMGFDQPDRLPFQIPVSDTQAYKQFGNAVVVPVVEAVAGLMRPHIEQAVRNDIRQSELPLEPAARAANG